MNGLDLFTGIGGITLGLQRWVKPVAYCEIDPYCQGVLLSRMADESLPNCPIWDDIRTLPGLPFAGGIDIIYGGFPCQDISIAGHGKGLDGERSGLFFEIVRLLRETRPRFCFMENVPAITTRGGIRVVKEITSLGYDCRWCTISAASVGALHKRDRWFLLAYSMRERLQICKAKKITEKSIKYSSDDVAYSDSTRCGEQSGQSSVQKKQPSVKCHGDVSHTLREPGEQADKISQPITTQRRAWGGSARLHWPIESVEHWQKTVSEMDQCAYGIPNHVDRLRALGNAVVPAQVEKAFEILIGGPC